MTRLAVLTVRAATPSGNKTLRQHWAARSRARALWQTLAGSAVAEAHWQSGAIRKAERHRRLSFLRVGNRTLDADNATAGIKMLLDALKTLGVVRDDSPAWCSIDVRQRRPVAGEKPHTIVEVWE
ncbi:MAG: hypothetical protein Q8S13_05540 [Dehalococcoidia bacterium]|nr:hypothetical protein [Dehalococcoidia bacterium]